jgi:hypothetical protein
LAEEFIEKWQRAFNLHDDRTIHSLLLRFFNRILPNLNPKATIDAPTLEILGFCLKNLPKVIISNYEKGLEIRHVLSEFFEEAFNKAATETYADIQNETDSESDSDSDTHLNLISIDENISEEKALVKENIDELLNLIENSTPKNSTEDVIPSEFNLDFLEMIQSAVSSPDPISQDKVTPQSSTDFKLNDSKDEIEPIFLETSEINPINLPNQSEMFDTDLEQNFLIPEDAKGSEFFEKKNREIVEKNILSLFNLFQIPDFAFRQELTELLEYFLGLFPDSPGVLLKPLINSMDVKRLPSDILYRLLARALDRDPAAVIFALVNYIQEVMIEEILERDSIFNIALIFHLFQEHVPIYPDYFMAHINLYIAVLGRYNEMISLYAAKIIEFFTQQGDETIDELFFELYRKIPRVNLNLQKNLVSILHQALDLSAPFILERYVERDSINKKLMREIYKNCGSSISAFQEISLEIAIAIWNFNAQIQIQRAEDQKHILKPIVEILKLIQKQRIYSPYLLLQAVRDLDRIFHESNPEQKEHYFQENIIERHILTDEKLFFLALDELISTLKSL